MFGDYPVFTSELAVSDKTKEELEHLIEWHDEALNWNEPNDDILWNDEQIKEFLDAAKKLYYQLCEELGSDYYIEFADKI